MALTDKQLKAIIQQKSIAKAYELQDGQGLTARVSTVSFIVAV
ncbi:hypothetical protein ACPV5L_08230 [Vibrio astriarenae]